MTSSIHNLCHLFRACGYCLDNSNKLIHSSDKGTVFLFCVMNQLFWLIKLRVHGLHDSVFTVYNCLNSVLHGSSKVKISPLSTSLSNSVENKLAAMSSLYLQNVSIGLSHAKPRVLPFVFFPSVNRWAATSRTWVWTTRCSISLGERKPAWFWAHG